MEEIKKMERYLNVNSFRNIGIKTDENNKKSRLLLNRDARLENLGDLVILIGANNSGKSNFLDALDIFGNNGFSERDIADYYFLQEECRPSISLRIQDGEDFYQIKKTYNEFSEVKAYFKTSLDDKKYKENLSKLKVDSVEMVEQILTKLLDITRRDAKLIPLKNELENLYIDWNKNSEDKKEKIYFDKLTKTLEKHLINLNPNLVNRIKDNLDAQDEFLSPIIAFLNYFLVYIKKDYEFRKTEFSQKYGYDILPRIFKYEEKQISNSMLSATPDRISSNNFFSSVFNLLGFSVELIQKNYASYKEKKKFYQLENLERDLNSKFGALEDDFNKLYLEKDEKYKFHFKLESTQIIFTIRKGNQSLNLDYQSTGFRWFFNLYFNLIGITTLKPGDIIIMDEPATNLHVKGQIELRNFLKKFAMEHKILIIIATHIPFLVDVDYLDEIRVVNNANGICSVNNNFHYFEDDEPDTLRSIKDSLTIGANVFFTDKSQRIFVEGVTDYNYLVAMKKVLGYDNLHFLPFNGLGNKQDKKRFTTLAESLTNLNRGDPIVLVDGDKAGEAFLKFSKENNTSLKVVKLSDANESFFTIESLFSDNDLLKYGIKSEDKNGYVKDANTSARIKKQIIFDKNFEPDEVTKENFDKLFKLLSD